MPPIRPRPWLAVVCVVVWSLATTGAMAQSPVASPGGSPGADGAGSLVEVLLEAALDDPAAVAEGEAAHRQAQRAALDVAAIDPALPGIMDDLDRIAAEVLAGYLADPPFPTEADPKPDPSPDAAASPEAAASRRGTPARDGAGRPQAMLQVGLNLTWGMASAAAESFIRGWRPAPSSMTLPGRPGTTSGTFETNGRFTAYTTTLTDSLRVEDGTIHVSYEFTMHSEVLDSASSATVASIDDRGRFSITINPCPAPGGQVDTRIEADSDLTVRRPAGGSTSAREHATATAATTVNDVAEIARTVTDLSARRTTTGSSASDVGFTVRYGADGTSSTALTQDDGSEQDLQATARGAAAAALAGVGRLVDAARTVWRARCLTVTPDPVGKEVLPGSDTTIGVTVHHAVEDKDIEVPVRATLEGVESIDPDDTPEDAPADITYRAGTEPRAEGKVTFKAISDRGMAERTETYRTGPRLLLDVDGDVDASLGAGKSTFTVTGRGLVVSFGPGDPPTVRVEGELRIQGRTSDPTGCRSRYSGTIEVAPDASARLIADGDIWRLSFLLVSLDAGATVRVRATCPSGSSSARMPAAMLLAVWALAREPAVVEIPNGSATVRVARSGPTPKQTWTLSLRPEAG